MVCLRNTHCIRLFKTKMGGDIISHIYNVKSNHKYIHMHPDCTCTDIALQIALGSVTLVVVVLIFVYCLLIYLLESN